MSQPTEVGSFTRITREQLLGLFGEPSTPKRPARDTQIGSFSLKLPGSHDHTYTPQPTIHPTVMSDSRRSGLPEGETDAHTARSEQTAAAMCQPCAPWGSRVASDAETSATPHSETQMSVKQRLHPKHRHHPQQSKRSLFPGTVNAYCHQTPKRPTPISAAHRIDVLDRHRERDVSN